MVAPLGVKKPDLTRLLNTSSNWLSRTRWQHRVRYPWVDQAIVREAEVECADFRECTELEMDGCELSGLDDIEWIWVKSLLGASACAMNVFSFSNWVWEVNPGRLLAAEAKASTSCAGGGWGKMVAIREDEEKSLWAAITSGAKGTVRLKRRKIGGERKLGHRPGKVWWIWVKNVCWCAETSPKIQGGTEQLTIDERWVPKLEVHQNHNTEPTTGWWWLFAPVEQDIRIINIVNPFYAAAATLLTRFDSPKERSVFLREGICFSSVTKHLQCILDALPSAQVNKPEQGSSSNPMVNTPNCKSRTSSLGACCSGSSRVDSQSSSMPIGWYYICSRPQFGIPLWVHLHHDTF